MAEGPQSTIFANPFFVYLLLPFLLVFVIVFSILQKAKILGDDKRWADIIVAMVIAFIFVGVSYVVDITLKFIPLVSLILIFILGFLLLFGFVGIKVEGNKGLQIGIGITLGIAVIGIILWSTGVWDKIIWSNTTLQYIFLFLIFGGALALVVSTAPKKSSSPSS